MATVVANPIQEAAGGRASRPSWVQQHVAAPVTQKAAAAKTFFAADPWQTTAVLASFISFAFLLISLISPWLMFSTPEFNTLDLASAKVVSTQHFGQATLLDVRRCVNLDAPSGNISPYLPDKACTTWLDTTGPAALNWMRKAGGASFAFVIFAIAPGFVAFWLTYLRRIGALKSLPNFAMRFRDYIWTIGFHAITAFFMMIAWSVWAGQVNANRNPSTYASLGIYTLGLVNGTLAPVPHQSVIEGTPITVAPVTDVSMWFGGGFGLAVTSFILSVLAGVVIFFFHVEKVQAPDATHPNAASATAPGPGAYIGTAGEGAAAYSGVDAHTGTRNSLPFPPAATEASSSHKNGASVI